MIDNKYNIGDEIWVARMYDGIGSGFIKEITIKESGEIRYNVQLTCSSEGVVPILEKDIFGIRTDNKGFTKKDLDTFKDINESAEKVKLEQQEKIENVCFNTRMKLTSEHLIKIKMMKEQK